MPRNGAIDQETLNVFAQKNVYWWVNEKNIVNLGADLDTMLVFILAKHTKYVEDLAREELGVTDEDFRRALQKAAPGVFMWKGHWEEVNKRFGFEPSLPFPELDWKDIDVKMSGDTQ